MMDLNAGTCVSLMAALRVGMRAVVGDMDTEVIAAAVKRAQSWFAFLRDTNQLCELGHQPLGLGKSLLPSPAAKKPESPRQQFDEWLVKQNESFPSEPPTTSDGLPVPGSEPTAVPPGGVPVASNKPTWQVPACQRGRPKADQIASWNEETLKEFGLKVSVHLIVTRCICAIIY